VPLWTRTSRILRQWFEELGDGLPDYAFPNAHRERLTRHGVDAHDLDAAIEQRVNRLFGHSRMVGEVALLGPLHRRVRPEQHDVQRLDAVAIELAFASSMSPGEISSPARLWVRSRTTPSP